MKHLYLFMMLSIFVDIHYVHGAADPSEAERYKNGVIQKIIFDRYPSLGEMIRLHEIFRTTEQYFWYASNPLLLDQIKAELARLIQGGHIFSELKPYAQDLMNLMNRLPVDDLVVKDRIADEFQLLLDNYSQQEDILSKTVNIDMIIGIEKEKINQDSKKWILEVMEVLHSSGLGQSFVSASSNDEEIINDLRSAFQALLSDAVQGMNLSQDQEALIRQLQNVLSNPDGSFSWDAFYQNYKKLFMPVKEEGLSISLKKSIQSEISKPVEAVKAPALALSRRERILQAERASRTAPGQDLQPRSTQQITQAKPVIQPAETSAEASRQQVKSSAPALSRRARILQAERAFRAAR